MSRARPIRLTAKEADLLALLLAGAVQTPTLLSLQAKLEAARAAAPKCVNIGPMEDVLITYSRGRVVPMGPGGHARASRRATDLGVTPDELKVVGVWLARQHWLSEPITIIMVLNKWAEWLPRARATAPPGGTREGLGGREAAPDLGSGPKTGGVAPPTGRPAPGLGGASAVTRAHRVRRD